MGGALQDRQMRNDFCHASIEYGRSRWRTLLAGGLERQLSLDRSRRSPRRARGWRWEPPGVEVTIATENARQRWEAARAKAIAWAAGVASDPRVVYLDTETTGFGPRAEIVDIAVVSGAGQVLLESLVRPERRIPVDAIAIHGITDADVRDAPAWCDLYDEVRRVLDGRRIVVYNVIFDQQMVSQACGRYALDAPAADWDCAMKKYAGFYGCWDATKRWYRFQKLERAVIAFGAEPGGHRAAADAFACRTVVLGMAATPSPAIELAPNANADESPRTRIVNAVPAATFVQDTRHVDGAGSTSDPTMVFTRWANATSAFHALLDVVPLDLRERPGACGVWSVREVVAHCAGWEWEGARRLRLLAADPTLPDAVYNVDGFNAASVKVRERQNWTMTVDELVKASNTLAIAAAAMPHDPRTHEWLSGRAADFEAHAAGLRGWLVDAMASVAGIPQRGEVARLLP
jgi:DNA polymerase III epsilon subunit-like protein